MLATSSLFDDSDVAYLVRQQGFRVDLPNEPEWEKAARGDLVGSAFSWGDTPDPERANYDDTGIQDTSAVGCFGGNSYGLHDMLGNVWEWTRSSWRNYPYSTNEPQREDLDAGESVNRVLRGSSWANHRDYARCAYREGIHPDRRLKHLGFRVVLRSAPA